MSIKRVLKTMAIAWVAVSLVGCAAKKKQGGLDMGQDGMGMGVGDATQFYGSPLTPEQERELLTQRTYQFKYDNYEIDQKDMMSIYAHAKHLLEGSNRRVRVEGHTDERGSREYNMALGELRAKSVANILMMKGVPQAQISVVSFGKERPVAMDHNEAAWQMNRRAEIVYEVE